MGAPCAEGRGDAQCVLWFLGPQRPSLRLRAMNQHLALSATRYALLSQTSHCTAPDPDVLDDYAFNCSTQLENSNAQIMFQGIRHTLDQNMRNIGLDSSCKPICRSLDSRAVALAKSRFHGTWVTRGQAFAHRTLEHVLVIITIRNTLE